VLKPPPQIRTKEEFTRCLAEGIGLSVVPAHGVQTEPAAIGRVTAIENDGLTVRVEGMPFDIRDNLFYVTDPGRTDM